MPRRGHRRKRAQPVQKASRSSTCDIGWRLNDWATGYALTEIRRQESLRPTKATGMNAVCCVQRWMRWAARNGESQRLPLSPAWAPAGGSEAVAPPPRGLPRSAPNSAPLSGWGCAGKLLPFVHLPWRAGPWMGVLPGEWMPMPNCPSRSGPIPAARQDLFPRRRETERVGQDGDAGGPDRLLPIWRVGANKMPRLRPRVTGHTLDQERRQGSWLSTREPGFGVGPPLARGKPLPTRG